MTMAHDKKRSVFFWKKSHSQTGLDTTYTDAHSQQSGSPEVEFEPDSGGFTEKEVNLGALFMPFVKNYVSNLSHNKSPTKLPYPPNFYYPSSSLQHQMNLQMQNIDQLLSANTLATPLERFLAVLRYTLSTCNLTKFPYKPIIAFLGETSQSYTSHSDGLTNNTTYYVGEQVEREPTGSAFYICNPSKGVIHEGQVTMIPKFKSAHIQVSFVGQRRTALIHPQGLWNETYVGDVPDLMIRLLRMHTELGGSLNLTCEDTGYAACVQFKEKPIFGGSKNLISGKVTLQGREIYHIDGSWEDLAYLTDVATGAKFELLNRASCQKLKVESVPLEQQPPTSGERVWGPLIETLHRQDFEQAKVVKAQIDVEHHARLANFEVNPFVPSFFHKNAMGQWQINDPNIVYSSAGGQPTM